MRKKSEGLYITGIAIVTILVTTLAAALFSGGCARVDGRPVLWELIDLKAPAAPVNGGDE